MEKKKYFKKYCKYSAEKIEYLDYKKPLSFRISLSERYKIMPRRLTGTSKKAQEMASLAIKRARHMAFIPYIIDRKNVVGQPFDIIR